MPKLKNKTEFQTLDARLILPCWHTLGCLRSPTTNPGSNPSPAAGQPNLYDYFPRSPSFESQTPALGATKRTPSSDAPQLSLPLLTNHQMIAIYGKEWEVSVLFRYFRILMNFEPAWGGQLTNTEFITRIPSHLLSSASI